jgi:peptide/nickel transport system substrate-binding protein
VRGIVRGARALLALAALALAACGGEAPPAALRVAIINDPILDPVLAPDLGSVMVNKVIFPGLVRPDERLHPTPDLARSWTVSDDGLTYTFALRPGVRWHDGQPFGAEDVKFTFERILDPASQSPMRSDFLSVERVDALDSLTVRFTLSHPFAPLLTLLGYNAGIIPKHLLAGKSLRDAVDFNRAHPVGTGPFRVAETASGASVMLVPWEGYYGAKPKLARVVFRVVPDMNAQVAQLRAGELDLATLEPAQLASVEHAPGIRIVRADAIQHYYVGFNQEHALFKSPLVRRALDHAVNREAIIAGVLRGQAVYPRGTIPAGLADYYDESLPRAEYDTAEALALLARAGWRRGADGSLRDAAGRPFAFTLLVDKGNPTREQTALAVQQDLARIGMKVTLRTLEFATVVRDHILTRRFDANLIWWTTPPDPDQYSFYATGQSNNHVGYSNHVADSLLLEGRVTSDPARRRAIYAAFQRVEAEDPPVLVLYYPRELQARSERLAGVPEIGLRDALRWSERFELRDAPATRAPSP